ncbi:amidohydrolase family protein [Pseudomonas sp. KNUC1026]|uniref:amidohydrolase family protein n=1 Tax=Pseudomonas sp. KNUC1026 TaxID=2893890 RepID=UPI0022A71D72|nr:amidohydrolase family protein [Pseudomonas sp. KNUC1026]
MAKALVKARPDRLLWGSDWPHPTVALESKPDDAHILDLFSQWAPNEKDRIAILRDNPASLYGF